VLEKGGYIRVVVGGSHTRYFPTDKALDRETFGLSDTDRAVLEAVADRPGISQPDLRGQLGRSSSVVSRSVNRLASLGYVTTTTEDRKRRVFPRTDPQPGAPRDGPR
jgi:uncharacterized membrane protein